MLMVNAGAAAPLLVPMESLIGHPDAPDAPDASDFLDASDFPDAGRGPAGDPAGAAAEASPASEDAVDRTGVPDAAPAAGRADSSSEPWPHTTGRTP